MDVFISADIEGITGIVAWSQCGSPKEGGSEFVWAREMMAQDVNAAIRGARAAGAQRIVVKDAHGNSKSLIARDLEPGVELVSGVGCGNIDGMMEGIGPSFGLAFLVGYHARAGTRKGIMCHTMTGRVHRFWINGMEVGEIGISAGVAGRFGVPVGLVTSDAAGCAEARDLLPWVRTAEVKEGYGRYSGLLKHPDQTKALIEQEAEAAVRQAGSMKPWLPGDPVTIKLEFNRDEEADMAERYHGARRLDGYTLERVCEDYEDAHRALRNMMAFAGLGATSND